MRHAGGIAALSVLAAMGAAAPCRGRERLDFTQTFSSLPAAGADGSLPRHF